MAEKQTRRLINEKRAFHYGKPVFLVQRKPLIKKSHSVFRSGFLLILLFLLLFPLAEVLLWGVSFYGNA